MLIINILIYISDNNIVTIIFFDAESFKIDCDNKLHYKLLKVPKSHATCDNNGVSLPLP